MLKTMQQKIIDYIEECAAAELGREVAMDKDFDNTGCFTLFKGGEIFEARFNFQTHYCTMRFKEGDHYYEYVKDMALLKLHLRSFVKFGDPTVLR